MIVFVCVSNEGKMRVFANADLAYNYAECMYEEGEYVEVTEMVVETK